MATDIFHFPTMEELRAFEAGVWFAEVPVLTGTDGFALTVRGAPGGDVSEREYDPDVAPHERNDLGNRILTSRVRFKSASEATAFVAGLDRYGGAFVNFDVRGTDVVVQQKRPDYQDDEVLAYDLAVLRTLIQNHLAQIRPNSASA